MIYNYHTPNKETYIIIKSKFHIVAKHVKSRLRIQRNTKKTNYGQQKIVEEFRYNYHVVKLRELSQNDIELKRI